MKKYKVIFSAGGMECSTVISAINWQFALEEFWKVFDRAQDIDVFVDTYEEMV
jgi:hypothetical protein